MKQFLVLMVLGVVVFGSKIHGKIERLEKTDDELREQNRQLEGKARAAAPRRADSAGEQDRRIQEIIARLSNENESLRRSKTDAEVVHQQLGGKVLDLTAMLQRRDLEMLTLGQQMAAMKASMPSRTVLAATASGPTNPAHDIVVPSDLRRRFRSKLRLATSSQTALVEALDAEISSGTTIDQALADPSRRAAVARSPLAQELIAVYQQDAKAFASAEAQEPVHPVKSLSAQVLAHIRQEIEKGAKASDLIADPNTRALALVAPELRDLIDEAARKNGE